MPGDPCAENILEIPGIRGHTLAEMWDIHRFDDVKEIQKLSGLGLVSCSSGKHKGETRINHRGRRWRRYWLFQMAKSAVVRAAEFKMLYLYYTTRPDNPLKKMQSLIVVACKLLRVIYVMMKKGAGYDLERMVRDISCQRTSRLSPWSLHSSKYSSQVSALRSPASARR